MVILGAGESGKGTAILAQQKGYDVLVSDAASIAPEIKSLFDQTRYSLGRKHPLYSRDFTSRSCDEKSRNSSTC